MFPERFSLGTRSVLLLLLERTSSPEVAGLSLTACGGSVSWCAPSACAAYCLSFACLHLSWTTENVESGVWCSCFVHDDESESKR